MARRSKRPPPKRKEDSAPPPVVPEDPVIDPDRPLEADEDDDVIVSEQDSEDIPSGSVQDQLLYQQGLEENRIDDSASASLEKAERARSRLSKRTSAPTPRPRRGQAAEPKRRGGGTKR